MVLASGLSGLGLGVQNFLAPVLIVERAPSGQTSVLLALNSILRTVGQALGGATVGALLAVSTTAGGYPALSGYVETFIVAGAASALTGVFVSMVRGRARRRAAETAATVVAEMAGS